MLLCCNNHYYKVKVKAFLETILNAFNNTTSPMLLPLQGDVKKTIEFFITDDAEPEDNETMQIGLVRTEGGSRILPSSDTVTILILANDYAAGLVGFHPISQSVIVKEGEYWSCLLVWLNYTSITYYTSIHTLAP